MLSSREPEMGLTKVSAERVHLPTTSNQLHLSASN